ncbi:MAG TPA: flagellar biosynthesis protein FlhF [Steroidobacteraceae bacterium]|nr:flagellar biosynthesis protein FlhF [Steroidobacteraceae bacterium]
MKIKRFVADSMREALEQVRTEQGPDAVIISNRRVDGGIELITAIDYDESLIEDALKRIRPSAAPAAQPESAARAPEAPRPAAAPPQPAAPRAPATPRASDESTPEATPPAAATARAGSARPAAARAAPPPAARADEIPAAAPRPQVVWAQDESLMAMRREVESLRSLLQDQLASLAWSDRLRREPLKALVLKDLSVLGVAPDIARMLADKVPAATSVHAAGRIAPAMLLRHLAAIEHGTLMTGGTYALVGPTGVGKTTTIAKIAARWAVRNGANSVALVSLDHFRIGARDQLATFARILGVPMHVAASARELDSVLATLATRRLVLIDTAGMSPRDARLSEQFATLVGPSRRVRTLLALGANGEQGALEEVVRAYAPVRPEGLVITKVDEAGNLGGVLSVALRHALPLAWLTNGQKIPDDLYSAAQKRAWLIKRAIELAAGGGAIDSVDDAYLATHFGKVATHG